MVNENETILGVQTRGEHGGMLLYPKAGRGPVEQSRRLILGDGPKINEGFEVTS